MHFLFKRIQGCCFIVICLLILNQILIIPWTDIITKQWLSLFTTIQFYTAQVKRQLTLRLPFCWMIYSFVFSNDLCTNKLNSLIIFTPLSCLNSLNRFTPFAMSGKHNMFLMIGKCTSVRLSTVVTSNNCELSLAMQLLEMGWSCIL